MNEDILSHTDLSSDQPLISPQPINCPLWGSYDNQPPFPTVLGVMMLSFACRSLSRHGELILKGSGSCLGRGLALRRRRVCESVLEETALSWVTSWLQREGAGEAAEAVGWPNVDSGVFKESM